MLNINFLSFSSLPLFLSSSLYPYSLLQKRRTHVVPSEDEYVSVPRSFVMRKGTVGKSVTRLMLDMRHVMEPYTALKLRVRKNNTLKDFVNVAGPIGVTHFLIFSKTNIGTYLRLVRLPKGPTLSFRIHAYSLASDVLALQKNPHPPGNEYKFSPLVCCRAAYEMYLNYFH